MIETRIYGNDTLDFEKYAFYHLEHSIWHISSLLSLFLLQIGELVTSAS